MITHNSGPRPIPATEQVTVTYRDGTTETGLAGDWDEDAAYESGWEHSNDDFDIVAYEIVVDSTSDDDKVAE